MDHHQRALLADTVRAALAGAGNTDADADAVLAELGWSEMLVAEPDAAIAIVCTELGRCNATATVLDDVLLHALGLASGLERAVLLPPFGASAVAADDDVVIGLASHRVATASELVVAHDASIDVVPIDAVEVTPVHGIDPSARLYTVRVNLSQSRGASWDPDYRGPRTP
ncbi:MAG TPA: hypothetical protein VGI86_07655, partial [Acidimicrobiia bacterium]